MSAPTHPTASRRFAKPYRAQFGAIHRGGFGGFLFTVQPPEFAEDVAHGLNAEIVALDLLEALQAMVAAEVEYMIINKLGDPEKQHNIKLARAAIAKALGQEGANQ